VYVRWVVEEALRKETLPDPEYTRGGGGRVRSDGRDRDPPAAQPRSPPAGEPRADYEMTGPAARSLGVRASRYSVSPANLLREPIELFGGGSRSTAHERASRFVP